MSSARFLVDSIDLDRDGLYLRGEEFRHLRARRLGPGATVLLFDGAGRQRVATIEKVTLRHAELRLHAEVDHDSLAQSHLRLELAQAALKADKLDFVIEKTTELGVSSLTVFLSKRCVSRPPPSRAERWQRIARSAAKQCGRVTVPTIHGPVGFDELLAAASSSPRLLFWEGSSARLEPRTSTRPTNVLAVVGPEGGFERGEVAAAQQAGLEIVGLGPRVLRAETAAVVAVTLCQRLWGDL